MLIDRMKRGLESVSTAASLDSQDKQMPRYIDLKMINDPVYSKNMIPMVLNRYLSWKIAGFMVVKLHTFQQIPNKTMIHVKQFAHQPFWDDKYT